MRCSDFQVIKKTFEVMNYYHQTDTTDIEEYFEFYGRDFGFLKLPF